MPDLRTWLNEVDKLGQLMTVDNVHWDLELSTLTEIINERSKTRPAILFDRIKGYPEGYRVAANLVSSTERLALTLGMDAGLSDIEFIQAWRRHVKKSLRLLPKPFPALRFSRTSRRVKTSTCSSFPCRAGMNWTGDAISAPTIW
jgi:UbiD family decarboxylase